MMTSFFQRLSMAFALLLAAKASTTQAETAHLYLPWCVPQSGDSYAPRSVRVGDTVSFTWSSFHNAMIYPDGSCSDTENAVMVGALSGASYTFRPADAGTTKTFGCGVGDHCASGQLVVFSVLDRGTDIDYTTATATPCGDGAVAFDAINGKEDEKISMNIDAADSASEDEESSGNMVAGRLATVTTTTVLSVLGAGIVGGGLIA